MQVPPARHPRLGAPHPRHPLRRAGGVERAGRTGGGGRDVWARRYPAVQLERGGGGVGGGAGGERCDEGFV
ncbi:hypothetical protein V496_04423 [Pseudogymnoascus sp. VKM F-4515 (FW-2607)]|nr:hypothetical protein V496_04423 [Pseudogymnoascus sp. VKM F-4515 (FW-2607)]